MVQLSSTTMNELFCRTAVCFPSGSTGSRLGTLHPDTRGSGSCWLEGHFAMVSLIDLLIRGRRSDPAGVGMVIEDICIRWQGGGGESNHLLLWKSVYFSKVRLWISFTCLSHTTIYTHQTETVAKNICDDGYAGFFLFFLFAVQKHFISDVCVCARTNRTISCLIYRNKITNFDGAATT